MWSNTLQKPIFIIGWYQNIRLEGVGFSRKVETVQNG